MQAGCQGFESPHLHNESEAPIAAAIEAHGLTKRYGSQTVVDALTLGVERGSLFGLLGPNGSGKSTTVKILCGLVSPSAGSARICEFDAVRGGRALRRRIGYMAQGFALYPDLTCEENLEFCARAYGMKPQHARDRKRFVARLAGIDRYYTTRAGHLSGGWQRRLGLAAALLHDPDVAFLDEPTAGVDPVARRELWQLFNELAAGGKTFFITTHDIDEAQRCSRVGYVLDGKLLGCGSVADLQYMTATTNLEDALVALVRSAEA